MPRPLSTFPVRSERGFALVLTVTLLAFLVLILVALASLTRVETQVATNNQQLAQARQNALMALNIALGQLQKYAGPDQRTTARADLEHGATVANGRWTGVYGSAVRAQYEATPDYDATPARIVGDLTDSTKVNAYGSSARLLNWLVSGNENGAFDPSKHIGKSTDGHSTGEITATETELSAGIDFSPDIAVDRLDGSATTSTSLTIKDAGGQLHDAALLVGPASVSTAVNNGHALDYVAAPLVPIEVDAQNLPGFAGTDKKPIGRYAWWVGDEGVKARVNLPLANGTIEEKRKAFVNATRAAIELMDGANPSEPAPTLNAPRIDTAYDPTADMKRLLTTSQLPMLGTDAAATSTLRTALKTRYHDLTPFSYSVLSDTYAGGLKQDLTHVLANNSSGPSSATTLWTPATTTENTTFIPTWGHLRSFYNTTATNGVITPQLPIYNHNTAGSIGISPVITYAAIGFRYAADAPPAPDVGINLCIYPLAVLWNPYANTLAGGTYELGIMLTYPSSHQGVKLRVNMGDDTTPNWVTKEVRDLARPGVVFPASDSNAGSPNDNNNVQSARRYWRFKITCPDLAPGESRVFTLAQAKAEYLAGQNELRAGFDFDHYAFLSDTTFGPDEADRDFKFEPFNGSQLRSSGHSHVGAYLGDGTAPPISINGAWDPALNGWYQSIQYVDYMGISDTEPRFTEFQGPERLREPISMDEPAVKVLLMCTFSAIGRSWTLNQQSGTNIPRFRWIAQGNIRAPYLFRTKRDPNHVSPYYARAGILSTLWPIWFFENPTDSTLASSGMGLDYDIGTNTNPSQTIDTTLFEFRETGQPLTSIGQLQHANLSLAGAYPSYPVGNSIADFRLNNTGWIETSAGIGWGANHVASKQQRYYDISWLLNRSLWDRYFLSTVPPASSGAVPATLDNPRLIRYGSPADADLRANADTPAAHLLLSGGFNINSTSEQAWRAVLGAANQLGYDPRLDSNGSSAGISISRFRRIPPEAGTELPTNVRQVTGGVAGDNSTFAYFTGDDLKSLWQGYRALTPEEIAQLARNIVAEIRSRGPFVSLADFVNRRIIDSAPFVESAAPYPVKSTGLSTLQRSQFLAGMKGVLQAAIDATTTTTPGSTYATNTLDAGSYWANTRTTALGSGDKSWYSQPLSRGDIDTTKTPQNTTAAFAPKFLTQADILSTIGAGLSARSDTFTIRSYGEVLDPVNSTDGNPVITGRAWCEAVVQRLPDYVDGTMPPQTVLASAPASPSTTTNQTFGREFKVVSFRWLSPDDI